MALPLRSAVGHELLLNCWRMFFNQSWAKVTILGFNERELEAACDMHVGLECHRSMEALSPNPSYSCM